MKKFILGLLVILGVGAQSTASAQSFTIDKDTVKGVVSDNGAKVTCNITNATPGAIKIDWKVISHNIPASPSPWNEAFGLCDNQYCYISGILSGSTQTTLDIAAGSTMHMYISYTNAIASATTFGPYYVTAELSQGSTKDTVTYILNKWSTSVNNVASKSADNVVLYPNPVRDDLNIVFAGMNEVKSLGIYNLIGKQVSAYKVNGTSASVNVESMPAGIYMLRLMDGQGRVVAVRKFNKQ
ncbi:MAG: T9SS type A sorting domain-containing protein [Flavipsychrobacter sp.]|jgi:hypothetical protein